MIAHEGIDEVVAMIIAFLHSHSSLLTRDSTCLLQVVGQQLSVLKETISSPLQIVIIVVYGKQLEWKNGKISEQMRIRIFFFMIFKQ